MLGYTMCGTNDAAKAVAFYDKLFAAMEAKQLMQFPSGGLARREPPDVSGWPGVSRRTGRVGPA